MTTPDTRKDAAGAYLLFLVFTDDEDDPGDITRHRDRLVARLRLERRAAVARRRRRSVPVGVDPPPTPRRPHCSVTVRCCFTTACRSRLTCSHLLFRCAIRAGFNTIDTAMRARCGVTSVARRTFFRGQL
jgi:hypothetical protein